MSKSTTARRTKKNADTEYIFLVSGGTLKAKHVYVNSCTENPETFARTNLLSYFTEEASGKYYTCEDSGTVLEKVLEHAGRQKNSNILALPIKEVQDVIKKAIGDDKLKAHNFSMTDDNATKKKTVKKSNKEETDGNDTDVVVKETKKSKTNKKVVKDTDNENDSDVQQEKNKDTNEESKKQSKSKAKPSTQKKQVKKAKVSEKEETDNNE
jgi:hypothetical protein